jgi:hypothetical protein
MTEFTKAVKASTGFPTLRTTIPRSIVKQFNIVEGDLLSWQMTPAGNEIVAVVTKYESNTPFTLTNKGVKMTNGPTQENDENQS